MAAPVRRVASFPTLGFHLYELSRTCGISYKLFAAT